jgi:hypothetical protein
VVIASFENGGWYETNVVAWAPLNLLAAPKNLWLRRGDSLRLTAALTEEALSNNPSLSSVTSQLLNKNQVQVRMEIDGSTPYLTSLDATITHCFEEAGEYKVTAILQWAAQEIGRNSITVKVVSAAFPTAAAGWVNESRSWECPGLPPEASLEADPRLKLFREQNLPSGGRSLETTVDAPALRTIVARLGQGGPILARGQLEGFNLWSSGEARLEVEKTHPDGSQTVVMDVVMSPVRPQVLARINLIVGGVIFEDGTVVKELIGGDYNELDLATVRFLRPAHSKTSVCHKLKAWQGTVRLGGYD